MTATITGLHLITDTGRSAADKITYEAPLAGQLSEGQAEVQFDHNGDGQPEAKLSIYEGNFQFDPVSFDSSLELWEAPLTLQYKVIEFDETGLPVAGGQTGSFSFVLDRVPPQTVDVPDITVPEDAPDRVISLGAYFNDGYTSDSNLLYQVSNSNSSLFTSVSLAQDTMTLDFAPTAEGFAVFTVTATDEAGLSSLTNFMVSVSFNPAPVISNFHGTPGFGNMWTFSGTVSDDQPVDGLIVSFGGIISGSAEVQSDGSFSMTAYLPNLPNGTATAVTHDNQGKPSNVALFTVFRARGDMDGDGDIDNFDIEPFEWALGDVDEFMRVFGLADFAWRGDCNEDGDFNNFDIGAFEDLLTS